MANVSVYDPFGTRLNRLFNNMMFQPMMFDAEQGIELKVDVTEDEKNYVVRADVPGAKKEDIKVEIDGNQVTITAEMKKAREEKKGKNVVYSERYEGRMFRSFSLGRDADESTASAKYNDGVLELTLPKKANGKARQLSVA